MSRSTSNSEASSLAMLSRPAALLRKTSIEIKIFDHYEAKIYTSGSSIKGEVIINPLWDTHFENLQIIFVGTSRTRLEAVQVPQRAAHTFLKLNMPIPEPAYPVPRVFEVGRTYTVPFHFVVPATLTLSACSHATQGEDVADRHMRLPPTLGGAAWDRGDLGPTTAEVEYVVKARALRDGGGGGRPVRIFEATRRIKVLPASPEDPPLLSGISSSQQEPNYTLSKSKSIRKNMFASKMGEFTARLAQPPAVHLDADGAGASGTTATVQIRFVPASAGATPPKVNSISAKLAATTYYAAAPMTRLPDLGFRPEFAADQRLAYKSNVPLFNTTVDKITWREQVRGSAAARRDSGYSTDHDDEDGDDGAVAARSGRRRSKSKASSSAVYHTATLAIPFTLPTKKKVFVPTFYSCLVSRVYALNLTLSVGPANTGVRLVVPLQVCVDQAEGAAYGDVLPSFDVAVAQDEERLADEHMQPRVLRVPAPELRENSVLPGYQDSSPRRRPLAA